MLASKYHRSIYLGKSEPGREEDGFPIPGTADPGS